MSHRSVKVIVPSNGTDGEGSRGDGGHVHASRRGLAGGSGAGRSSTLRIKTSLAKSFVIEYRYR